MKYAWGLLWIALAFLASRSPGARRWFGYLGAIVAFIHVCGLLIGFGYARFQAPHSVNGGVSAAGLLGGIIVGLGIGIWFGGIVNRNPNLYWPVQVAATAFILFLPLFRVR